MRIFDVSFSQKVNFGFAYSTKQENDFVDLMDRVEQKEKEERYSRGDYLDPIRPIIIHSFAIPSRPDNFDDGVGKINSPMAKKYYRMLKVYGGAKAVQFLPLTQVTDVEVYNKNHSASPYKGSGLALNEAIIHIPNLMTKEYANLLTKQEVLDYTTKHKENVQQQTSEIKRRHGRNKIEADAFIDLQTPLGWENQEDYPINEPLRIAYHRLMNKNINNPDINNLRKEFDDFKNQEHPVNYDKIYTRLALFPYIKDWGTGTTQFFIGYDSDEQSKNNNLEKINGWFNALSENRKNEILEAIDFYKFKQFIARKELKGAIDIIHELGMEAYGDVLFGNSWVEEQVFPDAFKKNEWGVRGEIGDLGGIPAYNFEDLINNPNSAARKFLKNKIAFNLDLFDGVRLDMGWQYIQPYYHFNNQYIPHVNAGTVITDFIADCARECKGNDFDTRKLMYECDADGRDFSIYQMKDLMKATQGLMILSTANEREDGGSYGSVPFYKEDLGFDDDEIIVGTNNQDQPGVIEIADDKTKCSANTGALMRVYKKRPCDGVENGWQMFKSDTDGDENLRLFTKGKLAEPETTKNNFMIYTNLFGRRERLDNHTDGSVARSYLSATDYKNRLQRRSEEWFHDALQANVAYNRAGIKLYNIENANKNKDGSQKVDYGDLYFELQKYEAYLKHPGLIKTREQADKSEYANLDISKMTLEEIQNL